MNVAKQAQDTPDSSKETIEPAAPKRQAVSSAGLDKHAKKALWDQRKADRAKARAQRVGKTVSPAFAFHNPGSCLLQSSLACQRRSPLQQHIAAWNLHQLVLRASAFANFLANTASTTTLLW